MMAKIATRRTLSRKPPKLALPPCSAGRRFKTSGTMMSFDTMMANATHSTITIAVAADRPPMNTITLSDVAPAEIGSASTYMSVLDAPNGKVTRPAMAMGITNRLIAIRYSGNSQRARRTSASVEFSTTLTWNCRGSSMIARNDSSVIARKLPIEGVTWMARTASGVFMARSHKSAGPNMKKVTKTPAAMKATSLTSDSVATASINPC